MTVRRTTQLVVTLSALLLLVGVVVYALTPPASFGWFAYSPLSSADLTGVISGAVLLSRGQAVGAALAVLGLVVAAGSVGFALGRRAPR